MHIHILGICGTFMGGIAVIAQQAGHRVTGADSGVYPPMSTQLEGLGIALTEGYEPAQLSPAPEQVIVGNVMHRGLPIIEQLLDTGLAYNSGPQWLAEQVLPDRWVLAVAGTHGKTTTAAMLAWILEQAGYAPGFLIGGVPANFGTSARLGQAPYFVIEADEYDTAFFDKRSKFVHYRPRTLILNNLEHDHADIFPDLAAIQWQFHQLLRTVPGSGRILVNAAEPALQDVLQMGCWTPTDSYALADAAAWQARLQDAAGQAFTVQHHGEAVGEVHWSLLGRHNVANALAAIAAAAHVNVPPTTACTALGEFQGVRRRLQSRGRVAGIEIFDDFAHHPTAIATTLAGLRAQRPAARLVAVLELRSNSMRMGLHRERLAPALAGADLAWVYAAPELAWEPTALANGPTETGGIVRSIDELLQQLLQTLQAGDRVVIMSNGGFAGLHDRLLTSLRERCP